MNLTSIQSSIFVSNPSLILLIPDRFTQNFCSKKEFNTSAQVTSIRATTMPMIPTALAHHISSLAQSSAPATPPITPAATPTTTSQPSTSQSGTSTAGQETSSDK
ncbi:hypothetical protein Vi05172_g6191 [Venturia inaequalis]|nr:hypothetical protein Vi05172_g6191 [Venturia inaequalis]